VPGIRQHHKGCGHVADAQCALNFDVTHGSLERECFLMLLGICILGDGYMLGSLCIAAAHNLGDAKVENVIIDVQNKRCLDCCIYCGTRKSVQQTSAIAKGISLQARIEKQIDARCNFALAMPATPTRSSKTLSSLHQSQGCCTVYWQQPFDTLNGACVLRMPWPLNNQISQLDRNTNNIAACTAVRIFQFLVVQGGI
jgi:hypothetical protein